MIRFLKQRSCLLLVVLLGLVLVKSLSQLMKSQRADARMKKSIMKLMLCSALVKSVI